uniref:Tc3 transposase DNA binding domain-containing protein n=1 Tax=Glossina austeni TaxID=7395 RepID=A0A1A9VUC4_GLOAU
MRSAFFFACFCRWSLYLKLSGSACNPMENIVYVQPLPSESLSLISEYINSQFVFCRKYLTLKAPRGSELADEERGKIERMRLAGRKIGEITAAINCHRNMVSNYLKHPDNYGRTKRSSRIPTVEFHANDSLVPANGGKQWQKYQRRKYRWQASPDEYYGVALNGKDTPNAKALRGDVTTKQTVSKLRADKPEEKTPENYWQTVKTCKSSKERHTNKGSSRHNESDDQRLVR